MGLVIDSSAIVAILKNEPEEYLFSEMIAAETDLFLSCVNYVEASAVCEHHIQNGRLHLDEYLKYAAILITPVSISQADIARNAYRLYGRGSGHKATLNMGDVFSYALAKEMNLPLLFKGNNFIHTDVKRAA